MRGNDRHRLCLCLQLEVKITDRKCVTVQLKMLPTL